MLYFVAKSSLAMLVGWGGANREAEAQEIMEIFLDTMSSTDIMLSDKSIK